MSDFYDQHGHYPKQVFDEDLMRRLFNPPVDDTQFTQESANMMRFAEELVDRENYEWTYRNTLYPRTMILSIFFGTLFTYSVYEGVKYFFETRTNYRITATEILTRDHLPSLGDPFVLNIGHGPQKAHIEDYVKTESGHFEDSPVSGGLTKTPITNERVCAHIVMPESVEWFTRDLGTVCHPKTPESAHKPRPSVGHIPLG